MTDDIDWEDAFERYHPALSAPVPPRADDWRITLGFAAALRRLAQNLSPRSAAAPWRVAHDGHRMAHRGAP